MQDMKEYGFIIHVADDGVAQVESGLGHLRSAYPDAPVTVISDGVPDARYDDVCRRHGVNYVRGAYLKRTECGGRWWDRCLREGLKLGAKWIVKMDADTKVWRPFRTPPPFPLSGTVDHRGMDD